MKITPALIAWSLLANSAFSQTQIISLNDLKKAHFDEVVICSNHPEYSNQDFVRDFSNDPEHIEIQEIIDGSNPNRNLLQNDPERLHVLISNDDYVQANKIECMKNISERPDSLILEVHDLIQSLPKAEGSYSVRTNFEWDQENSREFPHSMIFVTTETDPRDIFLSIRFQLMQQSVENFEDVQKRLYGIDGNH